MCFHQAADGSPVEIKIFDKNTRHRVANIDRRENVMPAIDDDRLVDDVVAAGLDEDGDLFARKMRLADLGLKHKSVVGTANKAIIFNAAACLEF